MLGLRVVAMYSRWTGFICFIFLPTCASNEAYYAGLLVVFRLVMVVVLDEV